MINGKGRFDACVEDPTLLQCDKNGCSVQDYVPAISVEQGKTYLFRVINAGGLVSLNLALANHTMRIMKTDGRFVNPIDVTSLELNLAQRYSVLVKADQAPESYWVADTPKDLGVDMPTCSILTLHLPMLTRPYPFTT